MPPSPRRATLASTMRQIPISVERVSLRYRMGAPGVRRPASPSRAYDRCGANSCAGSPLDPIIAFSPDGKVRRHFGGGLFQMPHGLTVDDAGNVWVTDNAAKDGRGMQVYKFSPQGQILMTLGTRRWRGAGRLLPA
jgi:hypothetical protein